MKQAKQLRDVWFFTRPAGHNGQTGIMAGWNRAERFTVAVWQDNTYGCRPKFACQTRMRGQQVVIADGPVYEWQGPHFMIGEPVLFDSLHKAREHAERMVLVHAGAMTAEYLNRCPFFRHKTFKPLT